MLNSGGGTNGACIGFSGTASSSLFREPYYMHNQVSMLCMACCYGNTPITSSLTQCQVPSKGNSKFISTYHSKKEKEIVILFLLCLLFSA